MAYRRTFTISLGTLSTGLSLRAQLYDAAGATVGGVISTGITEIGYGQYVADLTAIPANHRGLVRFYDNANPANCASTAINPEGPEFVDVAVSSRLPTSAYNNSAANALNARLSDAWAAQVDASISSRLATAGYTAPDNAGITTANASLATLLARLTATRAGLLDNLDAAISTRLAAVSYVAPDNAGIGMLESRLTATRAGYLDNLSDLGDLSNLANLDVPVSTRLAAADYDNGDLITLTTRLTETRANLLDSLDNLDVAVSTRLATADYSPPDEGGVDTLLARLTAERAGNLDHLDVDVSSRAAKADYTAARAAKLDHLQTDITNNPPSATDWTPGRAAKLDRVDVVLSTRLAADDYVLPDNTGIGTLLTRVSSARAALVDNLVRLDVAVSTRLAAAGYTAPNNTGITSLLARLSSTRANLLDNLDAAISSRLSALAYTAPDNEGIAETLDGVTTLLSRITEVRAALIDNLTGLPDLSNISNLDVPVSTRLAGADYTAPDNAGVATLLSRLTDGRATLLDSLVMLSELEALGDMLTAILSLPDIEAALSQRIRMTTEEDIVNQYVSGDTLNLTRSLGPLPAGELLDRCWLTIKVRQDDADDAAVMQKIVTVDNDPDAGQILDTGGSGTGQVIFRLSPTDTVQVGLGLRHYDIQYRTDAGTIQTPFTGLLEFTPQVTIATD